jgi:peptidoglycan/LPS O-acetylase OafA/YrhL
MPRVTGEPARRGPREREASGRGPGEAAGGRLAWLDALRGLAALCVVFDHATYVVLQSAHSLVSRWADPGQYGVFVFFLVSGYIIPASLERKGSIRGFWISRAFRLYPLYLFAVGLAVLLHEMGIGDIYAMTYNKLDWVLSCLLMMSNMLFGPNVPIVSWTLSYEMVFYLLLAALFSVRAHRASGVYAVACAIVVITVGAVLPMGLLDTGHGLLGLTTVGFAADGLILAGIGLAVTRQPRCGSWLAACAGLLLATVNQAHYPLPWSAYTILAFMFTGTLVYRAEAGQVARWKAAVVVLAVLATTVGGGLWDGARHPGWSTSGAQWQWQWVTSLVGAALTFGVGLWLRRRRVPKALAWLGMISYSVYLLHPLVVTAYGSIPALASGSKPMWLQVLLFAGLLAMVGGVSATTYYLLEAPMQRIGRQVARRFSDLPAGSERSGAQTPEFLPGKSGLDTMTS